MWLCRLCKKNNIVNFFSSVCVQIITQEAKYIWQYGWSYGRVQIFSDDHSVIEMPTGESGHIGRLSTVARHAWYLKRELGLDSVTVSDVQPQVAAKFLQSLLDPIVLGRIRDATCGELQAISFAPEPVNYKIRFTSRDDRANMISPQNRFFFFRSVTLDTNAVVDHVRSMRLCQGTRAASP